MRKRVDPSVSQVTSLAEEAWLDLESSAQVEVTSEDAAHPIENALLQREAAGWKAATPGIQTIRIHFDEPLSISLIRLVFAEESVSRTQEFVLRWSAAADETPKEMIRQQYNFSPHSQEVENYLVDLKQVKTLELEINPSINDPTALAALAELRIRGGD